MMDYAGSQEEEGLNRRAEQYPLEYYWIMLQTLHGNNCTYLETQFDPFYVVHGQYSGTCTVVGQPHPITQKHKPFLDRLEKHKQRKRQPLSLTISDCGYSYLTDSGLRVVISRGSQGSVFEGERKIGKAEGPSTAWIQLNRWRMT